MNCYNHTDLPAVGTCIDCGKGLCNECAHKYESPICDSCNLARIRSEKKEMLKKWGIISIVALFITIFYFNIENKGVPITFSYVAFIFYFGISIQYGWRTINSITPAMFLVLPIIGWFIYFVVKATVSAMIGLFITPIKIFQDVKRYTELQRLIKISQA